jgi:hypothetical protein
MTNVGVLGVIALAVIVLALSAWILMTVRANRDPVQTKHPDEKLKRGPVSGGAIRGEPGQNILTGEAPRQDDPDRHRHA